MLRKIKVFVVVSMLVIPVALFSAGTGKVTANYERVHAIGDSASAKQFATLFFQELYAPINNGVDIVAEFETWAEMASPESSSDDSGRKERARVFVMQTRTDAKLLDEKSFSSKVKAGLLEHPERSNLGDFFARFLQAQSKNNKSHVKHIAQNSQQSAGSAASAAAAAAGAGSTSASSSSSSSSAAAAVGNKQDGSAKK